VIRAKIRPVSLVDWMHDVREAVRCGVYGEAKKAITIYQSDGQFRIDHYGLDLEGQLAMLDAARRLLIEDARRARGG
jgi:hypothetical protein